MTEMTEASFNTTTQMGRSAQQSLLALVRGACDMLVTADPSVAQAITVSRRVGDDARAARTREMALRLAEEYDLDADVTEKESALTIRLSRNGHHIHLQRPLKRTTVDGRRT
jgi:hypothetical protein